LASVGAHRGIGENKRLKVKPFSPQELKVRIGAHLARR